jgi:hypothetical protein
VNSVPALLSDKKAANRERAVTWGGSCAETQALLMVTTASELDNPVSVDDRLLGRAGFL